MDEDKPIGRQISKKRKTLKEQQSEMEDQLKNAQEEIVSLRSHPISDGNFLALQIENNQKDALIHQLHFYYRWHFSKNANYTCWSKLEEAEQKKWTEEWAKIREVQKVQAAQGLIVLRSQIEDEVEDGPKWAMTLRSRCLESLQLNHSF
ncbi:hypothetical protein B9Z55_023538 [Caenorhabditis nigoni]|uniref:Uncharacterized protein n=1 Tax=Caenorhabditis nigoni TaxID=1611254 RepID=A0A2G5SQF2_9PELO|nr:hypothetical protein B9Z55_023538 [Caenorhabditis nigoni]